MPKYRFRTNTAAATKQMDMNKGELITLAEDLVTVSVPASEGPFQVVGVLTKHRYAGPGTLERVEVFRELSTTRFAPRANVAEGERVFKVTLHRAAIQEAVVFVVDKDQASANERALALAAGRTEKKDGEGCIVPWGQVSAEGTAIQVVHVDTDE